jgi:hypothetical protein
VKKWLAFNYLSDVFDEIAIELMVAHVFINSGEFVPKYDIYYFYDILLFNLQIFRTIWSAFFRFLSFLSTHDFVEEPIIVDMNNLFAAEQLEQAKKEFLKKRPALPPLILVLLGAHGLIHCQFVIDTQIIYY